MIVDVPTQALTTLPPEVRIALENLQYALQGRVESDNVDPEAPAAPTGVTKTGEGTYQASEGTTLAFVTLSWTNPTVRFGDAVVVVRQNGQTDFGFAARTTGTTARVEGLTPGIAYDFGVQAVSLFNKASAVTSLLNQVAPGDTTAPATPATPTVANQHLKNVTFVWTDNTEKDLSHYEWDIRTAATGGGTLVRSGKASRSKVTLDLAEIAYGTTRHFRLKAVDRSGNASAFSASVSFIFARAVTDDVGTSQVTTDRINDAAVTTPKRQAVNQQSESNPGPTAHGTRTFAFTVSGGTHLSNVVRTAGDALKGFALNPDIISATQIQVKMPEMRNEDLSGDTYTIRIDYW